MKDQIRRKTFLKTLSTPAVHSCHGYPAPPRRILLVGSGVLGESVLVVVDDVMVYDTQFPWGEFCGAEVPLVASPQKLAGRWRPCISADTIQQSFMAIISATTYYKPAHLFPYSHCPQLRYNSCTFCPLGNCRCRRHGDHRLHDRSSRKPTMEPRRTFCCMTVAVLLIRRP